MAQIRKLNTGSTIQKQESSVSVTDQIDALLPNATENQKALISAIRQSAINVIKADKMTPDNAALYSLKIYESMLDILKGGQGYHVGGLEVPTKDYSGRFSDASISNIANETVRQVAESAKEYSSSPLDPNKSVNVISFSPDINTLAMRTTRYATAEDKMKIYIDEVINKVNDFAALDLSKYYIHGIDPAKRQLYLDASAALAQIKADLALDDPDTNALFDELVKNANILKVNSDDFRNYFGDEFYGASSVSNPYTTSREQQERMDESQLRRIGLNKVTHPNAAIQKYADKNHYGVYANVNGEYFLFNGTNPVANHKYLFTDPTSSGYTNGLYTDANGLIGYGNPNDLLGVVDFSELITAAKNRNSNLKTYNYYSGWGDSKNVLKEIANNPALTVALLNYTTGIGVARINGRDVPILDFKDMKFIDMSHYFKGNDIVLAPVTQEDLDAKGTYQGINWNNHNFIVFSGLDANGAPINPRFVSFDDIKNDYVHDGADLNADPTILARNLTEQFSGTGTKMIPNLSVNYKQDWDDIKLITGLAEDANDLDRWGISSSSDLYKIYNLQSIFGDESHYANNTHITNKDIIERILSELLLLEIANIPSTVRDSGRHQYYNQYVKDKQNLTYGQFLAKLTKLKSAYTALSTSLKLQYIRYIWDSDKSIPDDLNYALAQEFVNLRNIAKTNPTSHKRGGRLARKYQFGGFTPYTDSIGSVGYQPPLDSTTVAAQTQPTTSASDSILNARLAEAERYQLDNTPASVSKEETLKLKPFFDIIADGETLEALDWTDYVRMASLGADVVAAGCAIAGLASEGAGNVVAAGLEGFSFLADAVANTADAINGEITWGEWGTLLGLNAGLSVMAIIPGLAAEKIGAKAYMVWKRISPWVKYGAMAGVLRATGGDQQCMLAIQLVNSKDWSDFTKDDWELFLSSCQIALDLATGGLTDIKSAKSKRGTFEIEVETNKAKLIDAEAGTNKPADAAEGNFTAEGNAATGDKLTDPPTNKNNATAKAIAITTSEMQDLIRAGVTEGQEGALAWLQDSNKRFKNEGITGLNTDFGFKPKAEIDKMHWYNAPHLRLLLGELNAYRKMPNPISLKHSEKDFNFDKLHDKKKFKNKDVETQTAQAETTGLTIRNPMESREIYIEKSAPEGFNKSSFTVFNKGAGDNERIFYVNTSKKLMATPDGKVYRIETVPNKNFLLLLYVSNSEVGVKKPWYKPNKSLAYDGSGESSYAVDKAGNLYEYDLNSKTFINTANPNLKISLENVVGKGYVNTPPNAEIAGIGADGESYHILQNGDNFELRETNTTGDNYNNSYYKGTKVKDVSEAIFESDLGDGTLIQRVVYKGEVYERKVDINSKENAEFVGPQNKKHKISSSDNDKLYKRHNKSIEEIVSKSSEESGEASSEPKAEPESKSESSAEALGRLKTLVNETMVGFGKEATAAGETNFTYMSDMQKLLPKKQKRGYKKMIDPGFLNEYKGIIERLLSANGYLHDVKNIWYNKDTKSIIFNKNGGRIK